MVGPYLPIIGEAPHVQVIPYSCVARYGFSLSEKTHRLSVIELREWERLPLERLPYFRLPDELVKKPAPLNKNKRKEIEVSLPRNDGAKKQKTTAASTPSSSTSHLSKSDAHILASAKKKLKARGIITLFPNDGAVVCSRKREGGRQKELKKLLRQGEIEYRVQLSRAAAAESL